MYHVASSCGWDLDVGRLKTNWSLDVIPIYISMYFRARSVNVVANVPTPLMLFRLFLDNYGCIRCEEIPAECAVGNASAPASDAT